MSAEESIMRTNLALETEANLNKHKLGEKKVCKKKKSPDKVNPI